MVIMLRKTKLSNDLKKQYDLILLKLHKKPTKDLFFHSISSSKDMGIRMKMWIAYATKTGKIKLGIKITKGLAL